MANINTYLTETQLVEPTFAAQMIKSIEAVFPHTEGLPEMSDELEYLLDATFEYAEAQDEEYLGDLLEIIEKDCQIKNLNYETTLAAIKAEAALIELLEDDGESPIENLFCIVNKHLGFE